MVNYSDIANNLDLIEKKYVDADSAGASSTELALYSKLATLELSGWIECAFDDIILVYANRKAWPRQESDYLKEKIVDRNYGFDYNKNIRPMFLQLLGFEKTILLETELERDASKHTQLKSLLGSLKGPRDIAAHTYHDATRRYNAPSVTKSEFLKYCEIFKKLENIFSTIL